MVSYPTPKSSSNSGSRKRKRIELSKNELKGLRSKTIDLQKLFGMNNKKKRKYRIKVYKKKRISKKYNVAADKDITSKTYKKQRVSKKHQRHINKVFKNGYSPFIDRVKNSLQLTNDVPNIAKWVWRTGNNFSLVRKAFANFPSEVSNESGKRLEVLNDYYIQSQEQRIYFNQVKYIYELRNPNNYDITVTIYDIVYKEDSEEACNNQYFNNPVGAPTGGDGRDDPLSLITRGLDGVTGYLQGNDALNTSVIVSDPNNLTRYNGSDALLGFGNPQLKPTDSYPFNIYCKIIKKKIYRLEPGATMTHIFTYKPKALLTRGYIGYKYKKAFESNNNVANNFALKNFTCGCLFKIQGQLLNSGNDANGEKMDEVGYYSGNIAMIESIENKWYVLDNKYKYINNVNNTWTPTDEEYATTTNPTDVNMVQVGEATVTSEE